MQVNQNKLYGGATADCWRTVNTDKLDFKTTQSISALLLVRLVKETMNNKACFYHGNASFHLWPA